MNWRPHTAKTLLVCIAYFLLTCVKTVSPVTLPDSTQEGRNTFGCLIGDQVWLPKSTLNIFYQQTPIAAYYDRATHSILIQTNRYQDSEGKSGFTFKFKAAPPYSLLQSDYGVPTGISYFDNDDIYRASPTATQWTVTRLDTIRQVVAGSFSTVVIGQNTQKQLRVSKGVFDLKLTIR